MASSKCIAVSDNLNCPICLKKYRKPRSLPCLHTFCEDCLGTLITSQIQDGSKFYCPVCRNETASPEKTSSTSEWANFFPLNNIVLSFTDSVMKSKEKLISCDPCRRFDEKNVALFMCKECKETLCETCHKYHNRMKSLSRHKTVSLEKAENIQQTLFDVFDDECLRHAGKTYEVFCCDHNELCCVLCLARHHRECKSIQTVDAIANQKLQQDKCNDMLETLRKTKNEVFKVGEEKRKNIESLKKQSKKILLDVDQVIIQAKHKLDSLRDDIREKCHDQYKSNVEALSTNEKSVESLITNIENCQKVLAALKRQESQKHTFIAVEKLKKQLATHLTRFKMEISGNKSISLTYKPVALSDILKTLGDLKMVATPAMTIADVTHFVDEVLQRITTTILDVRSAQIPVFVDLLSSPVVHIKTVKKSDLGLVNADITSGIFLDEKQVLLTDYNNKSLVVVRIEEDVLSVSKQSKLASRPIDVTRGCSQGEIYVACRNPNTVICCDLNNSFKTTTTINMRGDKGLCGFDITEEKMFTTMDDEGVTVRTLNNECLKTFGEKSICNYVRVSKMHVEQLYHGETNAVVCRTLEGKEIFRYEQPSLKDPKGICLDSQGNILVCCCNSGNLHQISPDGQRGRVVLEKFKSIKTPWSVIHNTQTNMFLVTSYNEETLFEIYKFTV